MEEGEALPDHLRCNRTDGKQWRCKRRVMDNLKLCEIHYLQGRHRQYKEKVPESLKLQRKTKTGSNKSDPVLTNVEIRAKKVSRMAKLMKRKRKSSEGSEALGATVRKKPFKRGSDLQFELIRMVLKREVEKRKKKQEEKGKNTKKMQNKELELVDDDLNYSEGVLTRELPNGLMAISPASVNQDYSNVDSHCDVRVGVDYEAITSRYFRSKNVERIPAGKLQVLPYARNLNKGRRKKCHWCQGSDSWKLIKCSTCQKEFFCMDCIKERYFATQNEVKMKCPVCRGTCTCKDCLASHCRDRESKEILKGKRRADRILHFHYLICLLLPVLKQINEDRNTELEMEAKLAGKRPSDLLIEQVELSCNEKNSCNQCKIPILDVHRSCSSCFYSLCMNCCQELCQGSSSGNVNSSKQMLKACNASKNHLVNKKFISRCNSTPISNGTGSVSCPPGELGGCGDGLLDLRCLFPLSWIKEMEVSAEEIVCSYDFPEISDKSSCCSLCVGTDQKIDAVKWLQEAALREDSADNYLFYPTVLDISGDHFEHFQKHWGKGHPVVVRDVLQSTSNCSWDPLVMFCSYIERCITRFENNKDLLEACLDWFEVEINIRQYFTGPLKGRSQKNTWQEMLKLKGWLSSHLFKEQFPAHFDEIVDALPLQEYMNPTSGILNLATNLPQGCAKHDLGPYVYISYDCADEKANSVTKLCYDSYDVVNVMAHTTDVPMSTEQLTKIRKLLKRHKALCQRESSKPSAEQLDVHRVEGNSSVHAEDMEQTKLQNMVREEMQFFSRINRTACISVEANKAVSQSTGSNVSQDQECNSDSNSEHSPLIHQTAQSTERSADHNCRNPNRSSNKERNKKFIGLPGAHWDVFRRQDVPKLIEYLKRHSNEFPDSRNYHKQMVHPILDQSFFLDTTHKMRLKEEFNIEPWTFEQHVGEAVIIPAGCPYQIRNPKCCVHVMLEFVSPENVTDSIQLVDEIRRLPENHKAKVDKLEVKKLALCSMDTAIKEIRELTCKK